MDCESNSSQNRRCIVVMFAIVVGAVHLRNVTHFKLSYNVCCKYLVHFLS